MSTKSIVRLIAEESSAKAVSVVEKALANKLIQAVTDQKGTVAKQTYGTIFEYFGADEQPEYTDKNDNAYAQFFAMALKKFGVSGVEDFHDEDTKQAFFNYIDQNWKAQDSVQGMPSTGQDVGTQTNLPQQAAQPVQAIPSTGANGNNDPNVSTMTQGVPTPPAGPQMDGKQPLGPEGDDQGLDALQNNPEGDPGMADTQGGGMGLEMGGDVCPVCHGTGKATCPTCGQPMPTDVDQDPDLEIGDEGTGEEEPDFGQNPEDEESLGGEPEVDENGNPVEGQEGEDPYDDDDTYSVGEGDFAQPEGEENGEEPEVDEEGNPIEGEPEVDEEGNPIEPEEGEEEVEVDENGNPIESEEGEEEDPNLEVGGEEEEEGPPFKKKVAEDFGFELDNEQDAIFIVEQLLAAKGDPEMMKRITKAQKHLDAVRHGRDGMLKLLRRHRRDLKRSGKSPEEMQAAIKQIAQMAQDNRKHFRDQAIKIKALHTGKAVKKGGSSQSGPTEKAKSGSGMDQQVPDEKKKMPNKNFKNPVQEAMETLGVNKEMLQEAMSKKHYIGLADHIKSSGVEFSPEHLKVLSGFMKKDNPAFDVDCWHNYVTGKGGPSGGKVKGV